MRSDISKFVVRFNDVPYERKSIERVLWGYKDLDYYTKGISKGLTIIVADTNMGKSILCSSIIKSASEQHYKTCYYDSEHTNEDTKMITMQQNGKRGDFILVPFKDTNGNDTNIADWYVNEEIEEKVKNTVGKDIILYNSNEQEKDLQTILDWIEYCHTVEGCKFCIIDNFTEIKIKGQDIFRSQEDAITQLRDTLLRFGMFGILVMHINKESATNGFRLTVKSARGTSTAGDKTYNLIALYRKDCIYVNKGQEKMLDVFKQDCAKCGFNYDTCDGFIEVLKTKGNGNGIVGLKYDSETKTYSQAEKITKTEADKIIRTTYKQQSISFDDLEPIDDNSGDLPF